MKLLTLAGSVLAVAATAVAGGLATDPDSAYYRNLRKPSWQPPPPVYGLVWTPLYADIALASGHVINRLNEEGRVQQRRRLIGALAASTWL